MTIVIKKSPSADTRSATEIVDKDTLLESSLLHIGDVSQAIRWMQAILWRMTLDHDYTKVEYIDQFYEDFKAVQSDTSINFRTLPWFRRHINEERHHVKDQCPDDVDLFDLLERIANIVTAGMARAGQVYDDVLPDELLQKAYKNTVELLKKQVVVVE